MEKNYKKHFGYFVLLVFLFITLPFSLFATHVQGGDITYSCVGGNQYRIKLSFYRDCSGVAAPAQLTVNVSSASCGRNYDLVLNRAPKTGIEVSPICPSQATVCTGGSVPGVQEYIFTGITNLPSQCTDWVISANIPARNAAISTIDQPGSQNLYIQSTLNNLTVQCNNSPSFTNKPVPFICVGGLYCFNNGAIDIDGDSLAYSLVTPMNGPGSTVTYLPPYTASQPLASTPAVTFNNATGDMCMTPTTIQVTVFSMIVQEYRNGVLIGNIVRDIQLRTVACSNDNPVLTGINGTGSFTTTACVAAPITFNIPSNDVNAGQTVTLEWNSGITGATFTKGTGAHPTATFSWTPTVADASNIPHCFTVKVTDDNCPFLGSQSYSFCITVSNLLATTTVTNAHCTTADGKAVASVTTGTPPYTYLWTPAGGTGATTTTLPSGTYNCLVKDAKGCLRNIPTVIGTTAGGTATIGSFSNISCNGLSNGSITVSISGAATPPLTYAWSPNVGTSATVNNLPVGTYTATVTDKYGCIATVTKAITQPLPLAVSATFTNVGCNGGANGTATATVTTGTGTAPYTYSWSPGGFSTSSISGLSIGTYTVTVKDAKGCTKQSTATITQPPALTIKSTVVNANCNQSDGSASVTGSGGFAPYTWSWSGGQTGANVSGLAAGTYTVTIKDLNLCTTSVPVTLANIAGPTAAITSSADVSCNGGNDGNATILVSGGNPPFTYVWNNGQITPTATNLSAGIYSVIAKDAKNCSAAASITIKEPTALIANVNGINPTCFGDSTGSATVSALGGTPPYTYNWNIAGSPTSTTVNGLKSGIYTVTVTDFKGCVKIASTTIINPKAITTSVTNTKVLCLGTCTGTATVTASNGIAPYTYAWNNATNQTSPIATGLCAGTYSVAIKDANGCSSQATTVIGSPTALISSTTLVGIATCFGSCDGYAQASAAGGTPPYTYSWAPTSNTNANATNLCAGSYTCTVTDANGCTSQSTAIINQPPKLLGTVTSTNVMCSGKCDGAGTINFSGGVPPYTFLWTPGLQTIYNPADLCVGSNTAMVTDANGCSVSQTILLTQPVPLNLTTSVTNSTCGNANGGACAIVTGGASPYTYSWFDTLGLKTQCVNGLPANTYNVSVTDANGCIAIKNANINDNAAPKVGIASSTNVKCFGGATGGAIATATGGTGTLIYKWTPGGQNIQNPTNLKEGINTVTVTDTNGCKASASVTITESQKIVSAITNVSNVTCNSICDGSATILYAGGAPALTIKWSDPAQQTTPQATNLCAGKYKVIITDAFGCSIIDSATIISQPNQLEIVSSKVNNLVCNGDKSGNINATVAGGTPFYIYNWVPNVSNTSTATNLSAGTYTLNIVDMKGCKASKNWVVTEPTKLQVTNSTQSSTCSLNNGSATVAVSGGSPNYIYQWNDKKLQNAVSATSLSQGEYICVIKDANGCIIMDTVKVKDLPGPKIDSIKATPVLCFGGKTGTAKVFASSGTNPLKYLWMPSFQTNANAVGFEKGSYNVIVTDVNGCTTNGTTIIKEPSKLSIITSPRDTICYGGKTQIYAQGVGGNPTYFYDWQPTSSLSGSGPHTVSPLSTTVYQISIRDANGCADAGTIQLVVRDPIKVVATDKTICDGATTTITANATGGKPKAYTYLWSNGMLTQSQLVKPTLITSPAKYIITVNDGCSLPGYDTATVTINPKSIGVLYGSDTVGCEPLTVSFNAVSNNGAKYTWNFGDGTTGTGVSPSHTYLNSGLYTVTLNVITLQGCITSIVDTNYVEVFPTPIADFTSNPSSTTFISPMVDFIDQSVANISSWLWDFDDPLTKKENSSTLKDPQHKFSNMGNYNVMLIVLSKDGCKDSVTHLFEVKDDFTFYAPNAFTPNGDGFNEIFLPKGIGFEPNSFTLSIFDRWGNFIFFSDDPTKGWDGRANHGEDPAQQDVYVWKVKLKDNNGRIRKYAGRVTIVK